MCVPRSDHSVDSECLRNSATRKASTSSAFKIFRSVESTGQR